MAKQVANNWKPYCATAHPVGEEILSVLTADSREWVQKKLAGPPEHINNTTFASTH